MAATSRKYFKLNESIFKQIVCLLDTEKVSNYLILLESQPPEFMRLKNTLKPMMNQLF